jgi:hypothetical protein
LLIWGTIYNIVCKDASDSFDSFLKKLKVISDCQKSIRSIEAVTSTSFNVTTLDKFNQLKKKLAELEKCKQDNRIMII